MPYSNIVLLGGLPTIFPLDFEDSCFFMPSCTEVPYKRGFVGSPHPRREELLPDEQPLRVGSGAVLSILTPIWPARPCERAATGAERIRAHALYSGIEAPAISSADAL